MAHLRNGRGRSPRASGSRRRRRVRRRGALAVAALLLWTGCSTTAPVIVIPAPPKMPEGAKAEIRACCGDELERCPWFEYYAGELGDFLDELDDLR